MTLSGKISGPRKNLGVFEGPGHRFPPAGDRQAVKDQEVLDQIEEDMKTQATPATTTQSKSNG